MQHDLGDHKPGAFGLQRFQGSVCHSDLRGFRDAAGASQRPEDLPDRGRASGPSREGGPPVGRGPGGPGALGVSARLQSRAQPR